MTNNDSINSSQSSSSIIIETGNKTASTGDSGDISLRVGTSAGGSRGEITLDTDSNSAKLASQPDGSDDLSISTTKYVDDAVADAATASPGDISETTFAIAESQTSVDVTGLSFDNAVVRSFSVHLSVLIDATTGLYETFELLGIQKGSQWDVAINTVGDNSQISFDITPTGQVQYSSTTYAGFTAGTIKFRAITTSV